MRTWRLSLVAVLVCAALTTTHGPARALVCGQLSGVPTFVVSLDPSTVPKPPTDNLSLPTLERYRADLEIFRQNSAEGYNRKLIAYAATLTRLDAKFRQGLARGACTSTDYEALKDQIEDELTKVGSDYLEPYRQSLTAYNEYQDWYQLELARLRFSDRRQGEQVSALEIQASQDRPMG